MSKRLQVVLDEKELREIRRAARRSRQTVSEWVRQVLRDARRRQPQRRPQRQLSLIRAAARHDFPAPEIEQMLEEIERGYLQERPG